MVSPDLPAFVLYAHFGLSGLAILLGLIGCIWPVLTRRRPVIIVHLLVLASLCLLLLAELNETVAPPAGTGRFWTTTAVLSVTCSLTIGARAMAARQGSARALPGILLMSGLTSALLLAWTADQTDASSDLEGGQLSWHWTPHATLRAYTDKGNEVPIFECPLNESPSRPERNFSDTALSPVSRAARIRLGADDARYNCHGFVFAGGACLVHGREVDRILDDNGYEAVTNPRVGDLIVYRAINGSIVHTGIVRATGSIDERELVLVESKWSLGGRFLHEPAHQGYSPYYDFYRSPRKGHQLIVATNTESASMVQENRE